jgi:putative NIF3 family GTP cyclohydrolase 1 type 2
MLSADLDVDLLFTGELSHHEALAAIEKGKSAITAFHSNSERAFLKSMRPKLGLFINVALANISDQEEEVAYSECEVEVSETDADPFEIITWDKPIWSPY